MSSGCTSNECIATLVTEKRNANYVLVASLTLLVYDYFLTIDLEIKHIWSSRLTRVNFLYYAVKYGVWAECVLYAIQQNMDLSTSQCQVTSWVKCYLYNIFTWAAEALVGISVWVMWQKDRRLSIAMPLVFAAFCVVSHIYLGFWAVSFKFTNPPSPFVRGCSLTSANHELQTPIIMVMAWIALMFVLMTISAVRSHKSGNNSTFIKMVYSRGIIYYVYLLCLHLGNLLALYCGPAGLLGTIALPTHILQITFTTRLILSMRHDANKRTVLFSDSTNEAFSFGDSQFAL